MQIEASIIQALKSIGVPIERNSIMLSDRNGVEPATPYLLINVISVTDIGLPSKTVSHTDLNRTETLYQVKDFLVSFTFHTTGNSPVLDWVQSFSSGIHSDLIDHAFSQQGLGIVRTNGMMLQPQPVDGKNYKRAILDIVFRAEVKDSFSVNTLNGVSYEGSHEDDSSYVSLDINFPYAPSN